MESNQSLKPDKPAGVASGPGSVGRGVLAVDDPGSVSGFGVVDDPGSVGGVGAVDDPGSVGRGVLAVDGDLVIDDLLVEEISIDGMCGVY